MDHKALFPVLEMGFSFWISCETLKISWLLVMARYMKSALLSPDKYLHWAQASAVIIKKLWGKLRDFWDVHKVINNYQKQPNKISMISQRSNYALSSYQISGI